MVASTIYLARGLEVEIHTAPLSQDAKDTLSTPVTPIVEAPLVVIPTVPAEQPEEISEAGVTGITNTQEPLPVTESLTAEPIFDLVVTEEPSGAITINPLNPAAASTSIVPTPFVAQYKLQVFNPVYLDNFAHQEAGCNWTGVAGQVFDEYGNTVNNIIVKVTGTWNGSPVSLIGITGMVDGQPYGPGSYEITISSNPMDTVSQLTIQLFDTNANPLTNAEPFDTSANCKRTLAIINFSKK